ncbi:MAG: DNA replication/repair protein RecF [Oscillospiraceae bacterium]
MGRQWIKNIELSNFRNITSAYISFSQDINIISGENAQGKTNFIEAIWLLSGGKSFRGSKDKELIKIGEENCRISADVTDEENNKNIVITSSADGIYKGRYAQINSGKMEKATSIAGNFYCVVFAPVHLSLISGSPALRRKFMDACLCQLYPNFISLYKQYNKYLEQKNYFLKNIRKFSKDEQASYFNIFDEKLSALSCALYYKRKEFCDMLSVYATEYYNKISQGREKINIVYKYSATSIKEFYELFFENRIRDAKMGYETVGIHREDIEITIEGLSAKDFASQGQQRSIVLALKLAESDIMKKVTGTEPVILLDDVLSELDFFRQEYLLNNIKDKQVFITSCDENRIKLAKSKKYYVENGKISECI